MKKTILIIGLIFCSIALADSTPSPQPSAPSTNPPPTIATPTNPNITIAPSTKDVTNTEKLFKDATYDNFEPQPEQHFINPDNLNHSE